MRMISAADLVRVLDFPSLVEALRTMFREGCETPLRHHHEIAGPGAGGTLLLMPAWQPGRTIGIKIASVFPDNNAQGLPAVQASYLLLDGATGQAKAMLDGATLTVRRTAAASALAADYLARKDASRMLMIGTGALAPNLVRAHAAVRPIREVMVWGRSAAKASALAAALTADGFEACAVADRAAAAADADVISCATISSTPLIEGDWLRPGTHVDLVGAYRPTMRESDDAVMRRGRVYIDTQAGGLSEAGDIVQAIASGALTKDKVLGDLAALAGGRAKGRGGDREITVFKSVGTALEDLAGAVLAYERT
jgi:alanine dehydrogenase